MPNPRDIFLQNLQPKFDSKENRFEPFRAVLTNSIGTTTTGTVWKDENARLVYFRAWGGGSVSWALCDAIEPTLGLGVLIKFDQNINQYDVLRDDPLQRNTDSDRTSYRAITNNDLLKGGRFQLWLDPTLFIPLSVYPTGADTVNVVRGDYIYAGERKTYAGTVDKDLSGSRPVAGLHRLVGLYLDSSNTLQTIDGTAVATAVAASEPAWPDGAFRLTVVDLDNATDISIDNIDNRKVVYTEDDQTSSGAWPGPGKVHRWDVSAGLVIIENDLPTAVTNSANGDVIILGIGTYTLASQLTVSTDISIIGVPLDNQYQEFYTQITADIDGSTLLLTGDVILANLYIENDTTTGDGHGVIVRNSTCYIRDCYIYGASGDDIADAVRLESTSATTRCYIFGGYYLASPTTTGYAVNCAQVTVTPTAYIYAPALLEGSTADTNAVASSVIRFFDPILATPSIAGVGTYYGEFRNSDGVTYYVGDTTPANAQFPKWDNANSRWAPGYVDELWESDAGAVAWTTDADGNLSSTTADIFIAGDEAGMKERSPNIFQTSITDHFDSTFSGWTWAAYAGFVTPANIDVSRFPSIVSIYNSVGQGAARAFAYQGSFGSDINCRLALGAAQIYGGLRMDDGTNNNYAEVFLESASGLYNCKYRYAVGGVVTGPTTIWSSQIIGFGTLRLVRTGDTVYIYWGIDSPLPLYITGVSITGWSPSRSGIYYEHVAGTAGNPDLNAMFDWYNQ